MARSLDCAGRIYLVAWHRSPSLPRSVRFLDQPVRLYSAGMRSRLAFAICVHAEADILIVDEALAVGDAAFRRKSLAFMESFRRRGTLIVVTHDMQQIKSLCDRVIWVDGGGIRASGEAAEVIRLMTTRPKPRRTIASVFAWTPRPARRFVTLTGSGDGGSHVSSEQSSASGSNQLDPPDAS